MKIILLGTASGLTVPDRNHASLYVENNGSGNLLDCGEGTTKAIIKFGLDPHRIDNIIITHTHPDHCSGIFLLIQYFHLIGRSRPLNIYLPKGTGECFQKFFYQLYLINPKLTLDYYLREYEREEDFNCNIDIIPLANQHLENLSGLVEPFGISIPSFSLLVSAGGRRFYYSADLRDQNDLLLSPDLDLAVIEATHIQVQEAMKAVSEKNIKRVVFTHIPPQINTEPLVFCSTNAEFAFDGMVIEL
jgi:ribonuclease Z